MKKFVKIVLVIIGLGVVLAAAFEVIVALDKATTVRKTSTITFIPGKVK